MKQLLGFFKLYRIDSFLITILSFTVTLLIVKGELFSLKAIALGLSLGVIFVNFIYSINSFYDAEIDAINKPSRPIPSGLISKKMAAIYIAILGVLSLLFPFFYISQKPVFYALYSFPVLGILYSNPLIPLKKRALFAPLLTTLIVILPATMALLYSNNIAAYWHFVVALFFYALVLVPLKDIEDVKGDHAFNSDNWAHIAGERRLLVFSMTGLALLTITSFAFYKVVGLILFSGVFLCSFCVELYFFLYKDSLGKLYKTLILSNLVLLVTGTCGFIIKSFIHD